MPLPAKCAGHELNYLHADTAGGEAAQQDKFLWAGLAYLRSLLRGKVPERVLEQYSESFAAFNRMRQQYGPRPHTRTSIR